MGLQLDSKTIQREKRYMGFNIQKGRDGQNSAYVNVATGYYDTFNGKQLWITEFEETIALNNDQLTAMFSIKPSQLGLTSAQTNLFSILDTAIYAVISGQISVKFKLNINVTDGTNPVTDYVVHITRDNITTNSYYGNEGNMVIEASTVLGATIKVTKYGYEEFSQSYPVLNGNVTLNATLNPIVNSQPEEPAIGS